MSTPSRADSLQTLEHEIAVLRRRVKRVVNQRAHTVHPDLHPAAYYVFSWIANNGPARASALVDAFDLDKGAVSRQLQQLYDLGLVVREPDPADGRASLISASPEARSRLEQIAVQRRAWVSDQLRDWSATDLADLAEGLARYNRALEVRPSGE